MLKILVIINVGLTRFCAAPVYLELTGFIAIMMVVHHPRSI